MHMNRFYSKGNKTWQIKEYSGLVELQFYY